MPRRDRTKGHTTRCPFPEERWSKQGTSRCAGGMGRTRNDIEATRHTTERNTEISLPARSAWLVVAQKETLYDHTVKGKSCGTRFRALRLSSRDSSCGVKIFPSTDFCHRDVFLFWTRPSLLFSTFPPSSLRILALSLETSRLYVIAPTLRMCISSLFLSSFFFLSSNRVINHSWTTDAAIS